MISRTILITSIVGLCVIGAGMVAKPSAAPTFDTTISHTGQDPVSRSVGEATLTSIRVASGLARPVHVVAAPGDTSRLFIVEQRSGSTGRIKILNLDTGTVNSTAFLSLSVSTGSEQGLLGLAFHPNYNQNGYFYVNYTATNGDTIIKRYSVSSSNPDVADSGSGYTIMSIDQPFTNHNGGWLGFSPIDGYLYIGTGDGGSGSDPGNRAQDITNQKLGKMLRIDVDGGSPYGIPASNPFVDVTGDDEIWAYGLRNPWRCNFDRLTGDLWMGDVGQNGYEEITFQPGSSMGGENYGWRCYEGNHAHNTSGCASQSTMTYPIWEITQGGSPYKCAVTGGCVYKGAAIPSLHGTYFFADYCSNQIWSFRYNGTSVIDFQDRTSELDPIVGSISSISGFGEDANGEIYVCDLGGEIFKIIAESPPEPIGACCLAGPCINFTEAVCNNLSGTWAGADVVCGSGDICLPVCPADITGDTVVNVSDLLALIGEWGACSGCSEDINDDNVVDVSDLLELISAWGPC